MNYKVNNNQEVILVYTDYLTQQKNPKILINWAIKQLLDDIETPSIIQLAGLVKQEYDLALKLFEKSLQELNLKLPNHFQIISEIIQDIDPDILTNEFTEDTIFSLKSLGNVQMCEDSFCPICNLPILLSYKYDAEFCINCNIWIGKKCGDPKCGYCSKRPEKPLV